MSCEMYGIENITLKKSGSCGIAFDLYSRIIRFESRLS
jgi:hypothetical protein